MILATQGGIPVPIVPAQQGATIQVYSISFDLTAHTYTMIFGVQNGGGPGQQQIDQGPIPPALQTALENHCQARVEAKLGISGTTIQTP